MTVTENNRRTAMFQNLNRQISWILQPTRTGKHGQLDSVFPMVFDRYYKVYWPLAFADSFPEAAYPDLPETVEDINKRAAIGQLFFVSGKWEKIKTELLRPVYLEELAQHYGLAFDEETTIQQLYRHIGKKPIQLQREPIFENALIDTLTNWLGANTKIRVFDFANFQLAALDAKYGQDWLVKTTLDQWLPMYAKFNDFLNQPYPYQPAYIFDKNKTWCIAAGSGLGSHYLWMATSEAQGRALEALDGVEVKQIQH